MVGVFILLLSDGSAVKSVGTYSLNVSLFHFISISYNLILVFKNSKENLCLRLKDILMLLINIRLGDIFREFSKI